MQAGSVSVRVVATLAVRVVVGLVWSCWCAARSVSQEQLAAAHAYLDAVRPIAHEGGRVV